MPNSGERILVVHGEDAPGHAKQMKAWVTSAAPSILKSLLALLCQQGCLRRGAVTVAMPIQQCSVYREPRRHDVFERVAAKNASHLSVMRHAHEDVDEHQEQEQQKGRCLLQRRPLQGRIRHICNLGVFEDRRGEEGDHGGDWQAADEAAA